MARSGEIGGPPPLINSGVGGMAQPLNRRLTGFFGMLGWAGSSQTGFSEAWPRRRMLMLSDECWC